LFDLNQRRINNPLDDQLRDAVTALHHDIPSIVVIYRDDLDLAAVPGIYDAWGVDESEPVPDRSPTACMNESGISGRQRNGDAGADQGATSRRHHTCFISEQIPGSIPGMGPLWQPRTVVQPSDEHTIKD